MRNHPLIGITLGDPAGIGPEIVARAVSTPALRQDTRLLAIGSLSVLQKAIDLLGVGLEVHLVQQPEEALFSPGTIDLIQPVDLDLEVLQPGVPQGEAGRAAYRYIAKAIDLALSREIDAIATAPINKEALKAGGVPYIDHTEMLAKLTSSLDPMTMFVLDNLRIFFLTRHLPLAEACRQVTAERISKYLQRIDAELRRFGMGRPRIAVAGLNPHAGEGGLFGTEEMQQVGPAVAEARAQGIDAYGPIAADSVFFLCRRGNYDAVLSLYHDQGHIAAKTVDFERTVSVTLGIPFLRTSVDHGTAFDIAWKGVASAVNMKEAIRVASAYASSTRRAGGPKRRPLLPHP